jgi:hypothetical protein
VVRVDEALRVNDGKKVLFNKAFLVVVVSYFEVVEAFECLLWDCGKEPTGFNDSLGVVVFDHVEGVVIKVTKNGIVFAFAVSDALKIRNIF